MKFNSLIFVAFASALSWAQAGTVYAPEMDCKDLKKLIVDKKVKTIDQLIPLLPAKYLRNPSLVYDSKALKKDLVAPSTPRILLFNEDGSMILSISRNPGQTNILNNKDSLETICFNKQSLVYEMMDIDMNGKSVPFLNFQPQINPSRCTTCHGTNPRPILQDYNAWAGFYGSYSQDGVAAHGSIEKTNWLDFLKKAPNMDRYKHLSLSHIVPDPYDEATSLAERDLVSPSPDYKFSSTTILGEMVQRNMEFRLAQKVIKMLDSGKLPKIRSLLAYIGSDLNTCGNVRDRIKEVYNELVSKKDLFSKAETLKKNIRDQFAKDFQHKVATFNLNNSASKKSDPRGVLTLPYKGTFAVEDQFYPSKDSEAYINQMVLLQAFGELLGLSMDDISSFPEAPSLGMVHILRLGLYKDEQFFIGLTEAMLQLDQFSVPRLENSCENFKKFALEQVLNLNFGTDPTLFRPIVLPK